MKVSVRLALEHIERAFQPHPIDAWLLAPADMPGILTLTIDRLIGAYECDDLARPIEPARIWAPRCGRSPGAPGFVSLAAGRRGGAIGRGRGNQCPRGSSSGRLSRRMPTNR